MTAREPMMHHLQHILTEILSLSCATFEVELEHPLEEVDPAKFNRAYIKIDGHRYAISAFVPGGDGAHDQEELDILQGNGPLVFSSDFRVSNPKLHELYVGWARETIQLTTRMCRELWDQSRWPASSIASAAWTELVAHIKTDAAWFEAAALEFMNPQGQNVSGPEIFVGESLRNIPPGEYAGYIAERDGKLYFELTEDMMVKGD